LPLGDKPLVDVFVALLKIAALAAIAGNSPLRPRPQVEFGRFGILAAGRPIRLGGRAVDVLMARL
jgi:hypothetical protein